MIERWQLRIMMEKNVYIVLEKGIFNFFLEVQKHARAAGDLVREKVFHKCGSVSIAELKL
jgi:hypothetical protein